MIDQSHNLKDKIEEMIQTAVTAQELYSKAVLVDHEKLTHHQMKGELIDAEECLKAAFATDVRPAIREWRQEQGIGGGSAPSLPRVRLRRAGGERARGEE